MNEMKRWENIACIIPNSLALWIGKIGLLHSYVDGSLHKDAHSKGQVGLKASPCPACTAMLPAQRKEFSVPCIPCEIEVPLSRDHTKFD